MSPERLQKVLASAGIASRRDCEELINAGRIAVNGKVVRVPGTRVDLETDVITVDGRPLGQIQPRTYVMLHKPTGVVSTTDDPQGRPTVVGMVDLPARLFPIGRLDFDSEGLLLLTDDGELTQRLTHPSNQIEKEYRVLLDQPPSPDALREWRNGVELEGARTAPAWIEVLERVDDGTWARVVLREGRKRQIREVAKLLGYEVLRLIRVREGPLTLGDLEAGAWRQLTEEEVERLYDHADEQERTVAQAERQAGPRQRSTRPAPAGDEARPARAADRPRGEDRPRDDRPRGEDRPREDRGGFGPRRDDRPRGEDRPREDRPRFGDRPRGEDRGGFGPRRDDRPRGEDRPREDRPRFGDRPRGEDRGGFGPRRDDQGGFPRRDDRPDQGDQDDWGNRRDQPPRDDRAAPRGYPRRDGGASRFGPRRDDRSREGGVYGQRRDDRPRDGGGFGPRRDDRPRDGGGFGPRRDDRPRDGGGFGPRRDDRPRDGGGFGPRRDDRPRDGGGAGFRPRGPAEDRPSPDSGEGGEKPRRMRVVRRPTKPPEDNE